MNRLLLLLVCFATPSVALAADEYQYQVAKRAEASMVVTGSIVVNPDGSVNGYTLDKQDKLPSAVVEVIGKTVPGWKFQPILILDANKKPMLAKAAMSLRVIAHPLADSSYSLSVRGASFGKDSSTSDSLGYKDRQPPSYPRDALDERISGIVYVVLKIGRDGRVEDAAAEQVDLRAAGSDAQMNIWRRELSRPAMAAARKWTFHVPQSGEEASAGQWSVRVPVNFEIAYNGISPDLEYGDWDAYVPGPVAEVPWEQADKRTADGSADAIPDNGIAFQDDKRFVLLNPPGNG